MNSKRVHNGMKIVVQLVPEETGGFSVFVPGLPGCMSQGETEEEALANMKELLPEYLEVHTARNAKFLPNTRELMIEA
ncbi:MAG: type II toxin-antitoxin system HicB family antitoxin [Methanoregula sp.]|nr:MAG: type II toxin-antitoxin system HicB family antitoxin [Methanoregula sp.]